MKTASERTRIAPIFRAVVAEDVVTGELDVAPAVEEGLLMRI
jgi:hypothetical protein